MAVTLDEAQRTIAAVEQALREGYAPRGTSMPRGQFGAIAIAAQRLKMDRQTIDSRICPGGVIERIFGIKVDWSLWQKPEMQQEGDKDAESVARSEPTLERERKIIQLSDEVANLKRKLKDAHREALDTEALREIIGGLAQAGTDPPDWLIAKHSTKTSPEVPMTIWSDWHAGETVNSAEINGVNSFDIATLDRRAKALVETTVHLLRKHGPGTYPGIVINLLGDFVSGGLHPELLKTDELEILPTILHVRDLLVWAIDTMQKEFGHLYLPCVSGNHGRMTQKPEFKRYVFKNADWFVYQLLARHFAANKKIRFDIPESNEVHYRVYGQRYLAVHGDMLGVKGGDGIIGSIGPIMRGEMKIGRKSAKIGRDYDVLLLGHWHQSLLLPRVIVANSLKGFDEYADKALQAAPSIPSQPLWLVSPKYGRTQFREVFLEDAGLEDVREWASWRSAS